MNIDTITIHRSNLLSALQLAIHSQREWEGKTLEYTRDSGLVAGWVELKKAIEAGQNIDFFDLE